MTLLAAHPTAPAVAGAATGLEFQRLEPTIGARVHGVDLTRATDDQVRELRAALAEYKVLFFSGQHDLAPRQPDRARQPAGRGSPMSHPVVPGVDETHPEIYELDSAHRGFADIWHTDVTFVSRRRWARSCAPSSCPPRRRHPLGRPRAGLRRRCRAGARLADQLVAGARRHPRVRLLPGAAPQGEGSKWEGEGSRPSSRSSTPSSACTPRPAAQSLFVNPGFVCHIAGVSDAESRHLLDLFYAHITKPEHIVRHRWSARRRRHVGQPRDGPLRQPRLRHAAACDAPHHPPRRRAGGRRGTCLTCTSAQNARSSPDARPRRRPRGACASSRADRRPDPR